MTSGLQAQKTFQDIQAEYDSHYRQEPIRDEDRAYAWHARQITRYQPGAARILDVACGGGFFLSKLRALSGEDACRLSGTDISGTALGIARQECPSASYIMSVAEAMPFQTEEFDAVTCLGSLEHFLDIEAAVREMKRISRPGALFYIMVPNMFWYRDILAVLLTGTRIQRNQTQERFLTMGEWVELLESAGMRVEKTLKYNGIAHHPLKQKIKDLLIPLRFSYHFVFICR